MKKIIKYVFAFCLSFITLQISAQPVDHLISGVPVYIWQLGCGPTSMGMIAGYYDSHGFPNLMPGDASTQTSEVDNAIASDGYYYDYCLPDDSYTPVQADKSELPAGDEHIDDCIADFMGTSRSIKGNIYGWSLPGDIKPAWENFISNLAPDYVGIGRDYPFSSFPWDSLVSNVDRNHPMIFLVDYTGDGVYDHFVCVIGYRTNEGVNEYGCQDTWDSPVRWCTFTQMENGVPWGILRCYTFEIHNKYPLPAGTISGAATVCKGQTSVVYTVPVITDATSYAWTLPSDVTGSSTTNSITVDFGLAAASGNISVKGQNANGYGTPSSLAITVNSLPATAGTISGNSTVCAGQPSVVYTVPVIANATNYVWSLPDGATGVSTTNSITVSYSASAVSGFITVLGNGFCGDGPASDLAITVNPKPSAAGTISGTTTVCQGQSSVVYTVPAISDAESYTWSLPAGATGSSTTHSITVNYNSSAVSGNISVKGTNGCGDGIPSTLGITVNPLPSAAGTISGTTTVCQGQSSETYSVASISHATSYIWSLPSGVTGTSTTNSITVNYGVTAVSGDITVKGNNTCGDGTESTLAITVNPLPGAAGSISGTSVICQGQSSVTYSVPVIANASTYIWSLPSGATGTSSSNSITVDYGTSAISGNISVKGSNSCGYGTITTRAITVDPLPSAAGTISGTTTVCQGENSVTYTVPAITNASSYIWALPSGATGTSTTNSISVNYGTSAISGNITVSGNNSCGEGTSSSLAVTVNPLPSGDGVIGGSSTVCQGQSSVTYTIGIIPNAVSYVWSLPSGATGSSTTNSITVNYSSSAVSGNISVKGSNSCGYGPASNLSINVNPLPLAAGTISGSSTVCQGETSVTYTVPVVTYATSYVWTLPTGAIGSSSTNSITVNYNTSALSGNITVKGNNSCGNGATSSLAITVNHLPSAAGTIAGSATVCQGQSSLTYSVAPISNATSYVWTLPSGATGTSITRTITVNFSGSAVSGNITVKGTNSCGNGIASTLAVAVNPKPVTPVISLTDDVLHSDAASGNQWYNQNGLIPGEIYQDHTVILNGGYFVIVTLNGCNSNTSNIINVIFTGLEPSFKNETINVYPNPVADEFNIEKTGNTGKINYEIINSAGQVVLNGNFVEKTVVYSSGFSRGVYIIKLQTGNTYQFRKIIKE
jgi:hypothetical protein